MQNLKPILLIEDDLVDAMTVRRALKELKVPNQLVQTANGEEALRYLRGEGNEQPCVILLDLNTPKMNGIEFLQIVKSDESLKDIPAVVLSTSSEQRDIDESSKLGAADYIVKHVDYKKFVETLGSIDRYWSLLEEAIKG